jgi:histidinol-phosphate phosphatase family protein
VIRAVLFDRDGTLIADDSASLQYMPGAVEAIARLRERGIRIGVVTNQPRTGANVAAALAMHELHRRIESHIGAIDAWFVCAHAPADGCDCRKPQPGLILQALAAFDAAADECVMIGDIGSDVEAAQRAGVPAILVPTPVTRPEEIARAPIVCENLFEAVDRVLTQVAA